MKARDLIQPDILGQKFIAHSITDAVDFNTKEIIGIRVSINLQDSNSNFFYENISVKIPHLNASINKIDKPISVVLDNLRVSAISNTGDVYWTADDVKPLK